MKNSSASRSVKPVTVWLLLGVAILIVQVLLGGITRLTGSGLSITEWKPIMGALPPMNEHDWNEAFEKYKQIAQYKKLNPHFTLQDFKFIFFWEWFHRLWARLIAVAFLVPFFIFLFQKRFKKEMVKPMIILFLLGALQGLVGWIMVMSGLEDSERIYVSHYRLAIHFILALVLICYTLWFALELLIKKEKIQHNPRAKKFTGWVIALLAVQLVYGAFMAGLKAAPYAPTWPDINGSYFPAAASITDDPFMVHFIHRNLAYLLTILIIAWYWKARRQDSLFGKTAWLPFAIVIIQVVLGVFTVLNSIYPERLLWLGVAHQFVAMLLLLSLLFSFFLVNKSKDDIQPA